MKAHRDMTVVVQGEANGPLFEALLDTGPHAARAGADAPRPHVMTARHYSSADSLARTCLVMRERVALVVDAGTYDPDGVAARQSFLEYSLGEMGRKEDYEIFVFVPTVETILFHDRAALERLVGAAVTDTDLLRGEYEPRPVLDRLLRGAPLAEALQRLTAADLDALRAHPLVARLARFVALADSRAPA